MKIIVIFSCSGMFWNVPECSGMFRNVPSADGLISVLMMEPEIAGSS